MTTTFTLEPHVGALPIRFGMSQNEVSRVLGPPKRVTTNFLEEREEQWDSVFIRYSGSGGVIDLSLVPPATLHFHGNELLNAPDPIVVLLGSDPDPFEWVGSVIFLAIGVSLTGYHDGDHSERAITIFAPGRYDDYRSQLTPMKR